MADSERYVEPLSTKVHMAMANTLLYLASPYSHEDPAVRHARSEAACRAAAELIRQGKAIYSPIAYSHPLCQYGLPLDWQFWQKHDLRFLEMCSEVIVLKLPQWEKSVGVQAEIAAARAMNKPVTFVAPGDFGVSDVLVPTEQAVAMRNDARAIKALLTAHYADRAILERLFLTVAKTSPELRDVPLDFVTIGTEVAEAFGVGPPSMIREET